MKILMLTPYLPYPLLSGGQIRTYNLLRKLSSKHQITLFSLIKDYREKEHLPEIDQFCHQVRVFKRSKRPFTPKNILSTAVSSYPFLVIRNYVPEAVSAIKKELKENQYDLIHAETFYMMPHLPKTDIPIILAEQTIEYLGYESYAKKAFPLLKPLLQIDINKIKHWERHYWQQADRLITMSLEDKKFINHQISGQNKVDVVSNGVDSAWFDQVERDLPKHPTLLYVGTFKWLPNIEAVNFLVSEVWPLIKQQLPGVRLKIVGNAPTKKIRHYGQIDPQITVSGRVPDIRSAFKQAHVLVAPVFSGKGTRYKILEAMACGTPIVASSTAVEGLDIEDNKHALISNQAQDIARKTIKVINNRQLWQRLSAQGYQFVRENYDWKLISKKLDKIYQSMG